MKQYEKVEDKLKNIKGDDLKSKKKKKQIVKKLKILKQRETALNNSKLQKKDRVDIEDLSTYHEEKKKKKKEISKSRLMSYGLMEVEEEQIS